MPAPAPDSRTPTRRARIPPLASAWAAAFLLALTLSWSLPLLSRTDPASGTLTHPRLFPVYYQSNVDAPLELETCLGFPEYYREQPYRISRPTWYALLAGLRELLAEPAARLLLGEAGTRWGAWSARETLITYFLWLLGNAACIGLASLLAYRLLAARILPAHAGLAALMLLTTPILLLAMREIHLNAYQVLTALACLAFWEAVLARGLRTGPLAACGLLLGLLFLGKPNLNLFAAGALLCLLLGQGRKLLLILPAMAAPALLWMAAAKAMGLSWSVPEVTQWKAGVWILEAGPAGTAREALLYVRDWAQVLGESLTPAHLLLACAGGWTLWKGNPDGTVPRLLPEAGSGRRLLALAALLAAADFAFYFLVHRVHAAYYVGTLLAIFALAVLGAARLSQALVRRFRPAAGPGLPFALAAVSIAALQAWLLFRQLPRYPG